MLHKEQAIDDTVVCGCIYSNSNTALMRFHLFTAVSAIKHSHQSVCAVHSDLYMHSGSKFNIKQKIRNNKKHMYMHAS